MQFSAVLNSFIVKTYLNSTFTNDLKRKEFFFRKMFIVTEYAALKHIDTEYLVTANPTTIGRIILNFCRCFAKV